MSDFDFEELDKAVSGALGGVSDRVSVDESATSSSPAANTVDSQPPQTSVPITRGAARPAERPESVLATRRSSGRFMDMVHPASDMRTSRPTATTPVSPSFTSSPATADLTVSEPSPSSSDSDVTLQPESPFLPDAKVEKRPLGGPASADSSLTYEPLPAWGETPADDEAAAETIETAEVLDVPEAPAETPIGTPDEFSFEAEAVEATPVQQSNPTFSDTPEQPAGPSSITQQYSEQPSSSPESGAIYDTEAYHKPLTQPASKKQSGVWVVVWIIGLVLIGAAAGAAVYLYVLPLL